jgi:hypothetical protein
MSYCESTATALSLAVLTLSLAVLPTAALADTGQGAAAQAGFDGTIDVQPGSIDGRVVLESGTAALQATIGAAGPQGQLQILVPGHFAGAADVGGGALSYQLQVCGAGVTVALNGTRNTGLQFAFRDAARDPARCTAVPTAALEMAMGAFAPAAAQTPPATPESNGQAWLLDWLRRLVGFGLVGTLLVLFIPAMPRVLAAATQTSPWGRVGIGLALAFLLPLLGLFGFAFLLPVGLWWLGLLVLALYPVLIVLSLSVSGLALGSLLARLGQRRVPTLAAFAAGLIVISIASLLPFVGPLVNVAAVIFGLGTLALSPRTPTTPVLPPAADERAPSNSGADVIGPSPVVAT